jgi:hypothetical protein
MNDVTYNGAWDAVEKLMEEYYTLRTTHSTVLGVRTAVGLSAYSRKEFVSKRNEVLVPFGVTYEEISAELERRVQSKINNGYYATLCVRRSLEKGNGKHPGHGAGTVDS